MVGRVLNEMCVKLLFRWFKVWQFMTCRSGACDGQVPVSLQGREVHEDRVCRDAQAAEITDELEAGGVDVAPVDHLRRVPDPGDPGVVDDAESGTVAYDRASEVAGDGVSGFLVLEDDHCPRLQPKAFRSSTEAAK